MRMLKCISVLVVLLIATGLLGCDTATTQQKNVVCNTVADGKNIRIITITSKKSYWGDKQKQVREKVRKIVNGGRYNIIAVKTFYSDVFLTSAEVKYSIGEDCNNKGLRVLFFHSNKRNWDDKQKIIQPKLSKFVNSGRYDIQEVNTIMLKGCLVAAEVYYYEKREGKG